MQELNKKFVENTGYTPKDIVGKPMTELANIIPPDNLDKALRKFSQFLKSKKIAPFEIQYKHKNGEIRWLEINAVNMQEEKEISNVIGTARDITEEKKDG